MNTDPRTIPTLTIDESNLQQQLHICNACRYCEGFCAVFPAMTQRLDFTKADIHYLANLCHNCGACLHSCQYAAPHEFDVNIPRSMAHVRLETYTEFAWPIRLGALYKRNGLALSLVATLTLTLFLAATIQTKGSLWATVPNGDFYTIFPHNTMVGLFGPIFTFAIVALAIGMTRFWRSTNSGRPPVSPPTKAAVETAQATLTLKYLDGGHGEGCNDQDDTPSLARRRFHHLTFYGFLLCFMATTVATLYHYGLGWVAPYPRLSLPNLLGTLGGMGMVVGTSGLLYLNAVRDPEHGDTNQRGMDRGFIVLLLMISLTGLLLMGLRDTPIMPLLLATHLATVMTLFLMMPYSKFAHGFYRCLALLKYYIERKG